MRGADHMSNLQEGQIGAIILDNTTANLGVIEVRVRAVAQLFNSLDPSPFRERDLDDDAEDFIVTWAQELPRSAPFQIIVHLSPDQVRNAEAQRFTVAIANYFHGRARRFEQEKRELFRAGRRHLWVGMAVLATCLLASHQLSTIGLVQPFSRIIEESLVIVGWVANWKPIDIFLYEWWPIKRRIDLYRRLGDAEIIVRAAT